MDWMLLFAWGVIIIIDYVIFLLKKEEIYRAVRNQLEEYFEGE